MQCVDWVTLRDLLGGSFRVVKLRSGWGRPGAHAYSAVAGGSTVQVRETLFHYMDTNASPSLIKPIEASSPETCARGAGTDQVCSIIIAN
jgi:hypothetical protein